MIDVSKYEGHITKQLLVKEHGRMLMIYYEGFGHNKIPVSVAMVSIAKNSKIPTAFLFADAPLILAGYIERGKEIERLRVCLEKQGGDLAIEQDKVRGLKADLARMAAERDETRQRLSDTETTAEGAATEAFQMNDALLQVQAQLDTANGIIDGFIEHASCPNGCGKTLEVAKDRRNWFCIKCRTYSSLNKSTGGTLLFGKSTSSPDSLLVRCGDMMQEVCDLLREPLSLIKKNSLRADLAALIRDLEARLK